MTTTDVDPRVLRTRQEALSTVLSILAAHGSQAVTHQRVAEESGVSRATLYRHWPDRSSLLLDACMSIRPTPPSRQPSGDLRADLLAVLTDGAALLSRSPLLPQLIAVLAAAEDDEDAAEARAQLTALQTTPFAPLLEDAVQRAVIEPDLDPDLALASLIGPVFILRFVRGRALTPELLEGIVDGWMAAHAR